MPTVSLKSLPTPAGSSNAAPLLDSDVQERPHCCANESHPPLPADIGDDNDGLNGKYVWLGGRGTAIEEDIECYISWPTVPAKCVVVVCSDIFGPRTGRHAQICDALAADGFVACCPDLIGDSQARAKANLFSRWPVRKWQNIFDLICCCKLHYFLRALPLAKPTDTVVMPRVQASLEWVAREHAERAARVPAGAPVEPPLSCCCVVGFCWGATIAARILAWETPPLPLLGGIGFHPSIEPNAAGKELLSSVARPFLLAPAGNDHAAMHPGGELAEILVSRFGHEVGGSLGGESGTRTPLLAPFKKMLHGWMTRGPLEDAAIAAAYQDGLALTTRFLRAVTTSI